MFGGEGIEANAIEIDESLFWKRSKYNRGKQFTKHWVLGIAERNTNKTIFEIVENRKKETLLPIILKYVWKSATIHHDDWVSYRGLARLGFKHSTVNHSRNFVSDSGACTNTIEGYWGVLKQRIVRMHGIHNEKLNDYVQEYTFRLYYNHNILQKLLDLLKK